MRSPCTGAALDPPLWIVPNKALSLSLSLSLSLALARSVSLSLYLVHDTTTTMPGPCSEKSASPREGRVRCRSGSAAGVPPWDTRTGRGWIRVFPRIFFPFPPCLALRATSLSLQGDPTTIAKAHSLPPSLPPFLSSDYCTVYKKITS